jgi:hypothetical protein
MAYLSSGVAWINQFGLFGWACAGVASFVLTAMGMLAVGMARERFAFAKATRKWSAQVDTFNPLNTTFDALRIRISELPNPFYNKVSKKTFNNCDLVGPANICMSRCYASGVKFLGCDFVVIKIPIQPENVILFDECNFVGGTITRATIFAPQNIIDTVRAMSPNINVVTYENGGND